MLISLLTAAAASESLTLENITEVSGDVSELVTSVTDIIYGLCIISCINCISHSSSK